MISQDARATSSTPAGSNPRGSQWVELIHEISKCHRLVREALNSHASRWKVNDTEFLTIWICQRSGQDGISQSDLAAAMGASTARISGLVEDLRQRGLLVSHRNPRDRRRQLWRPTNRGSEIIRLVCQQLGETPAVSDLGVSAGDQAKLFGLLRRLSEQSDLSTGLTVFTEDIADEGPCTEAHHESVQRRAV
jgi:DNA-binding MarR family transcriptional regulator